MQIKNFICTACPRGCRLTVEINDDNISVSGNKCSKGNSYGKEEAVCPMRVLTTTVATSIKEMPRLPVKSSKAVPLKNFPEYMRLVRQIKINEKKLPGNVIIKNFAESGADLIASWGVV